MTQSCDLASLSVSQVVYKYAIVDEAGAVEVEEGEPHRLLLPARLEDGDVVALSDVWQVSWWDWHGLGANL